MVKLGERRAGDHVTNFCEAGVRADAAGGAGEAHPDFSAGALDGAGEGTVVDDFITDGGEASDTFESGAAKEDAAAGGSGGSGPRVGDPVGRVEHEEKVEEGRDEEAFRESAGFEQNHEGGQVEVLVFGAGDDATESVGSVDDVGIGKPEKLRT